jgi:hypothetical protein
MKIQFGKEKSSNKVKTLNREWIADMETDGIRFSHKKIETIKEYNEKMNCSYSGLPSIYAYE